MRPTPSFLRTATSKLVASGFVCALVAAGPLAGCDGEASSTPTVTGDSATTPSPDATSTAPDGITGAPDGATTLSPVSCTAKKGTSATSGRVVDAAGKPLDDFAVLACTLATCIRGSTADDGTYCIADLPVKPHKMQVIGEPKGYATVIWYQDVVEGGNAASAKDVVLVPLDPEGAFISEELGGAAVVAGGGLEISVAPGEIEFPLGTFDEKINGAKIEPAQLPPYDMEPWAGKEAGTLAFIVNPYPLKLKKDVVGSFGVKVMGAGVADGLTYDVYTADSDTGALLLGGTATAVGGDIVVDSGADLHQLTTLVFVPR